MIVAVEGENIRRKRHQANSDTWLFLEPIGFPFDNLKTQNLGIISKEENVKHGFKQLSEHSLLLCTTPDCVCTRIITEHCASQESTHIPARCFHISCISGYVWVVCCVAPIKLLKIPGNLSQRQILLNFCSTEGKTDLHWLKQIFNTCD